MSLKIDKVTDWARNNGAKIDSHWGQDLPSPYSNLTFGRSAFGFASDTFRLGKYTMGLSPTDLTDWDAIKEQAINWGLSKAGSLLTNWLASTHRDFLDDRDRNQLLSGQWEGYRFNHKIEYRGYMAFAYNDEAKHGELSDSQVYSFVMRDGEMFKTLKVPFFENPKITETRSANYASQDIINRNEPYRVWMGSKAKKVKVDFKITLPHLLTFASEQLADLVKKQMLSVKYQRAITFLIMDQLQLIPRDVYDPDIPEPETGWLEDTIGAVSDWIDTAGDDISNWASIWKRI